MPECAQVSALHIRPHFTTLIRNRLKYWSSWLKYYRRNQENRFCVTHFWPTLQNHVTDGSKHMRQLDKGVIKLFSLRCLYASIFNSFWNIWTKVSKWWKFWNFFEVFGPPCRNAFLGRSWRVRHKKSNPLPCLVYISTTNLNFYKKMYTAILHSYLRTIAKLHYNIRTFD